MIILFILGDNLNTIENIDLISRSLLILLTISLCSERITEIILGGLWGSMEEKEVNRKGSLSLKNKTGYGSLRLRLIKNRTYIIHFVTAIIGFGVAWILDVSLFEVLEGTYNPKNSAKDYLGFILTGLAASVGSKFWHDLIGIVGAVKEAKKELLTQTTQTDREGNGPEAQNALINDFLNSDESDFLMNLPNVHSISAGVKKINGLVTGVPALVVRVVPASKGTNATIPSIVRFRDNNIPIDVIEMPVAVASIGPIKAGFGISPSKYPTSGGTLGLLVKKKKNITDEAFWLTCFHVAFPDKVDENFTSNCKKEESKFSLCHLDNDKNIVLDNQVIGSHREGGFEEGKDYALIQTASGIQVSDKVKNWEEVSNNICTSSQLQSGEILYLGGLSTSGPKAGQIASINTKCYVTYESLQEVKFKKLYKYLIEVHGFGFKGDSGAPVITAVGDIAGFLIASTNDGLVSYLLPAQTMLNHAEVIPFNS